MRKKRSLISIILTSTCILLLPSGIYASWSFDSSSNEVEDNDNVGVAIDDEWEFDKKFHLISHSYKTKLDTKVSFVKEETPSAGYLFEYTASITTTDADHSDLTFTLDDEDFNYTFSSNIKYHCAMNSKVYRSFYGDTYYASIKYDGTSYLIDIDNSNRNNMSVITFSTNDCKYVHLWGGSLASTSWPGLNLDKDAAKWGDKDYKGLYYISFARGGYRKIIFHNNSGTQSEDIKMNNGNEFEYLRYWNEISDGKVKYGSY